MKQTLFYLPASCCGIPLFGFGILFWLVLLMTLWMLWGNYRRQQPAADYWNSLAVGLLAEVMILVVVPRVIGDAGFPIRGYGTFLMFAILASGALILWRGKKLWNIPPELLLSTAVVAVVFGVLGARFFYVVEYWDTIKTGEIKSTLVNIFDMVNGGLVVYGSIIGGILALLVYMYLKKMPVLATFDLFAPALMMGIAIGRLGCLMNGCCFGAVCDHHLGIVFPVGSPAHLRQLEQGETYLAGIILKYPLTETIKESTLLGIKPQARSLWTETQGAVVIDRVDPASPAAQAGLESGMIIKEICLVGKKDKINLGVSLRRQGGMFTIRSNSDLFQFLFNTMTNFPDDQILIVCLQTEGSNPGTTKEVVFLPDYSTVRPVYPTQIISSINLLVICFLLLFLSRFFHRDGLVFATMLLLYPTHRFFIELLRTDEDSFFGTGLTVSQCISLLCATAGLILLIGIVRYGSTKRAWQDKFPVIFQ